MVIPSARAEAPRPPGTNQAAGVGRNAGSRKALRPARIILTPGARRAIIRIAMSRPLRALASTIVGITTIVGIVVYEHYSVDDSPGGAFTMAVAAAAMILTWLVTGLE
jgi:hypothetical protein